MKTFIVTYKEEETIKIYEYFFKKYWPTADTVILGHKEPSLLEYKSDFIEYEFMGSELGASNVNRQLYDYFTQKRKDESQFIFCVDDMPLIRTVNAETINYAEKILKDDDTVGRVGLTEDNKSRPHKVIDSQEHTDGMTNVIENNKEVDYRLSATWSAWNRDYFLKYLKTYENLWRWELEGSNASKKDNYRIMGFVLPPMIHVHMIKQRTFRPGWYEGCTGMRENGALIEMHQEDRQKIKEIILVSRGLLHL